MLYSYDLLPQVLVTLEAETLHEVDELDAVVKIEKKDFSVHNGTQQQVGEKAANTTVRT